MPPDTVDPFARLSPEDLAAAGPSQAGNAAIRTPIVPVPPDAPPMAFRHPRHGEPSRVWPYHDAGGRLVGYVARWDFVNEAGDHDKEVLPVTYCDLGAGRRGWRSKGMPAPRPLLGLPTILARPDAWILICEGEKTATAAAELFPDMAATTPAHGARSPHLTDFGPVAGRVVVIATDHDQPGRVDAKGKPLHPGQDFGDKVCELTRAAGARCVYQLRPDRLGAWIWRDAERLPRNAPVTNGFDLADALKDGWTAERVADLRAAEDIFEMLPMVPEPDPVPDMTVLRQGRRLPPALPLEVFGPFWAEWLGAAAEGAGCPVDYVAGPLLAAAATLIGNARYATPWPGWKEPAVLRLGMVGDPSSGKSPGADPVLELLRAIEGDMAADFDAVHREWATRKEAAAVARETWQKAVKEAVRAGCGAPVMPADAVDPPEPIRPRVAVSDVTTEAMGALLAGHPKGLLFWRDELAGWFGQFDRYGGAGGDRAFWLESYGGRSYTIDRVKHPVPIRIPHLTIGVLGGIQPDRLADLLRGDDDGLAARFLWSWPDPVPPRRPTRHADPAPALAAFRRLAALTLAPADDGGMRPWLVPLADDAADLFEEWRAARARIEAAGTLASAAGKAPGHVLRLALTLEFLWWAAESAAPEPANISVRAVAGAAHLYDAYFWPMAELVYGDAAMPEANRLAAIVARWIVKTRPEVVNARDLRRKAGLPGLRDAEKVKLALAALVDADWITPMFSRAGGAGGRQKEDYRTNPKLWEAIR